MLAECEARIERALDTSIQEAWPALVVIRDQRLYRTTHATFEEYCRDRWRISRAHAYRMIEAARVVENLSPMGDIPTSERQVRPLAALTPEQQRVAWVEAVATAPNGKPTGAHVERTITAMFPRQVILQAAREIRVEDLAKQRTERTERRLADLEARAAVGSDSELWRIVEGDCVTVLRDFHRASQRARLIVADPPYNQGMKYGKHFDDAVSAEVYLDRSRAWMTAAADCLTDDGSLWVIINWEWQPHLALLGQDIGLHLRQTIVWYETFGANATRKYNRCSRPLLWFVKDPDDFVFLDHAEQIRRPSDRLAKYDDPRADPDGKLWDDVWGINPPICRLVGNTHERMPDAPTQLPVALLRPIVAGHAEVGDLVLDPFAGTGTTGAACIELGRRFLGIELSPH